MPGGDEPHYLIITQSLLKDGDLKIENNHRSGDYRAYFAGELPKPDYRRRGRNGEIYSIHAPGLPALVAPAFAIARLSRRRRLSDPARVDRQRAGVAPRVARTAARRRRVVRLGGGHAVDERDLSQLHRLSRRAWRRDRAHRRLGAAARRAGGARAATSGLARGGCTARRWRCCRGSTRDLRCIAGSLGALVLLRLSTTRNAAGKAVAFLAIPAVSAVCWIGFFVAIYGTPDPSAPYAQRRGSAAFIPGGLAGLFFDQRFGLLAYAPVLVCAFAGLGVMVTAAVAAAARPRAAVRAGAVPARGHALRDVVGRHERAGAVLRADAADARRFRPRSLDRDPPSRDARDGCWPRWP